MQKLSKLLVLTLIFTSCNSIKKPNVVIFLTDDQGTLDANCFGSKHLITPNMDKLATTGVRFTQAYAHTVCPPSRASLITGRHPQRSGVWNWTQGNMNSSKGINMALEEITIAESLKLEGYQTALFGKWHLGAHRDYGPKKQGFDEFFGIRNGFIDNYNFFFLHDSGYYDLYEGTTQVQVRDSYFPELMIERSLQFIDENKDQPFFLYVPFNIPHYPEQAIKEHEELYKDINDPAMRSYGAIITTTDYYIGQVMDKLEEHSLRNNTIIVFTSDNGHSEETGYRIRVDNHKSGYPKGHFYGASGGGSTGEWIGQKGSFLEGGIRVPAIMSYPARLPQGIVRGQIVTVMDWFPTILALLGIERPSNATKFDGFNIVPIIEDENTKSQHSTLHFGWGNKWAVREGDWKLIGIDGKPFSGNRELVTSEDKNQQVSLHNIAEDMPEVKDHYKDQPEIVARLRDLHESWVKDVRPQ